ncbi:HAMP domain-containing protein, partial [Candidatus Pyrohabitans sp.]
MLAGFRISKDSLSFKIIVLVLFSAMIPLTVVTYFSSEKAGEALKTQEIEELKTNVEGAAAQIVDHSRNFEDEIRLIKKHPAVQRIIMERYENRALDEAVKNYEKGAAYPQLLRDSEAYQEVLNYFMEIARERPNIDMIRIFWKDGNVLVGVKLGKEDVKDYKGDKGWFDDIIRKRVVAEDEVHISAISIARATGTPAIRYSMPFDVNGERVGLIIINYKADEITEPIKELKVGDEGYGMLIDPRYRNAEGKVLGALFVANGRNPELEFDEASAGNLMINPGDFTGDEGVITYTDDGREWTAYYKRVELANGREYYTLAAIPSAELTAVSRDIRRSSVLIAGIAGILVVALGLAVSRRITRPIDRLVEDANAVAEGDLDREIKVLDSRDEVGVLTRAIQKMKNNVVNALRKSDSVIKSIPDPLVTVDAEMRVTYFNSAAEEITGYSASQAEGRRLGEVFQEEVESLAREAMTSKNIVRNREAEFSNMTGGDIPVLVNAAPLLDAKGDVYGGLVILKDMRELKEREREITEVKEYLEAQVERLLPVVRAVAEGDLTRGIKAEKNDAFGTLIETFNRTRENLAKLVTQVKLASERVAATAEEQAASSEELNAASDEITSAVQQIASKAQNQARL